MALALLKCTYVFSDIYIICDEEVVEEADFEEVKEEADFTYKCTECSKFYSSIHTLDRHKKLECGKAPSHLCHLCSYITKQACNLTRHLALKHNIIPESKASSHAFESRICYKCGSTFKTKNSLDDHLRYTCGHKPTRVCPFCEYKSVTPSQLSAHIKNVHKVTPIRKVRSGMSDKISQLQSFRVSGGYKCNRCGKIVKSVYGLQRHLIKVCGAVESEFCPFCSFKCKYKTSLHRHMLGKHQVTKEKESSNTQNKEENTLIYECNM